MFTNEFGQTIRPDWVSFSITGEQLSNLASVVFRSMVRDSNINAEVEVYESEITYSVVHVYNAIEEHVDPIAKAMGVELELVGENIIEFNDDNYAFNRLLQLMFGDTATYSYDVDGDYIIQIGFDDYIRKTFAL